MNKDTYGEIINGQDTYKAIADKLKKRKISNNRVDRRKIYSL